jgi:L-cystine uptake protein TcyP (sodium:dicarboxylate symporter family)
MKVSKIITTGIIAATIGLSTAQAVGIATVSATGRDTSQSGAEQRAISLLNSNYKDVQNISITGCTSRPNIKFGGLLWACTAQGLTLYP